MSEEKKDSIWSQYSEAEKQELEELNKGYREFLTNCKTERESVKEAIKQAEAAGYRNLADIIKSGEQLAAGAKVYAVNMEKAIVLFNIGTEPLEQGMNILGAHIDTCRLDVKQNPLYEDGGLAYLDTHYYGGIKKYQWVTLPLALHGVVAKKDGSLVEICIGEDENDPVFCVTDLLIHLSQEQMKKNAAKVIEGENLDILVGNYPLKKDDKESVKEGVLKLIKDKYDLEEADFQSAELALVPAGKARELGFDRSMILAYGQDDRVCSYTSLRAMLEMKDVKRTACCLLVDKEEIGSVGATGMQSRFFENTVAEVMNACGAYSELGLRRLLANCKMLSSDVSSAYDALYASAYDKKNVAYLGKGMVFNKFTGARGKSGSNDANAEYLGELRTMMDKHNVHYQLAELGKVDLGGGGTIAYIMSLYGMQVIDSGVGVMSMHAPWEVTSKIDVYEVKKGYMAFLQEA
ncbi:putative M18 family aminopeptidase [Selenomonas ruminantium subsp. lactilytica TAM6421]|uniref:M18 family aminopeptidase n=1 Tax=Selenomonas ruminantium subsp. lactilytica (strain NBRC 103574 / TAM6421) TaxID=927704 RepID=I0GS67_SELRL|nr:aminopeptidase [Selenomonas ruminantium]BAL83604.1 putative M18 family aminopeptidase [Selenomonas ruminantium subsp. lactilytica TAM6421]